MIDHFKDMYRRRELLYVLTVRDIQIRYKQSLLGITWAVLQPLALMLMFTLIFSVLLKVDSDGIPYPIFAYSALMPWTFFASSLNRAIPSLETNQALIKKIYFPREFFPISSVFASFVDFLIAAVIFVGMMIYYDISVTINLLYIVPVLLIQIIFTLAICLFASAFNVYYRDVKHALPLLIQLWLYASPIIYPLSSVPERYKTYYLLNPMAGIMDSYRSVLVKGTEPDAFYLGVAATGAVFLFIVCYIYFKRIEMTFADVI